MSIKDFAKLTEPKLKSKLTDLRKESFNLRFQQANMQLENTAELKKVRKKIAQVKTLINQNK